jgi:release factor glutamine methyltransferase
MHESPSVSAPPPSCEPWSEPFVVSRLRAAGCVFAEDEARLLMAAAATRAELAEMVGRRAAGLPLEHIVGWAEFCGLRIVVGPGVFVPRRRTEFLVRQAAARAAAWPRPVIVDLCCGSGAIGAALAALLDRPAELHAADIDPAAAACARRNLAGSGGHVYCGDLFEALPAALRGRVNVLTANVPYVPASHIGLLPAEARDHEPRVAVDGGPDGLAVLRRVSAVASPWLAPGGCLLTETSDSQSAAAAGILSSNGLVPGIASSDELDATIVTGERPVAR